MSPDVRLSAVRHGHLFQIVAGGSIWIRDFTGDDPPLYGFRLHSLNLGDAEQMVEAGRVMHLSLELEVTPFTPGEKDD